MSENVDNLEKLYDIYYLMEKWFYDQISDKEAFASVEQIMERRK